MAIDGEAGNGDEEGAGFDAAGVMLDVLDDNVTVATHQLGAGNLLDERCKYTSVAHRSRPAPSCSVIEGTTHVKEIREHAGGRAPDEVLAPAVGGEDDPAAVDFSHVVDEIGRVGEVVEGHLKEGRDLLWGELEGVRPLAQPANERTQAEVAARPDLVDLPQQVDVLGGDADIDNFLKETRSNVQDLEAAVLQLKARAVQALFDKTFVTGNATTDTESCDGIDRLPEPAGTTLICPFDSLLWQRKRAAELLDFRYTVEIYVPAKRRKYGYYVLPILHDGRLVGRLDPKLHRDRGVLEIRALHLEPDFTPTTRFETALNDTVADLAGFLGATGIVMPPSG